MKTKKKAPKYNLVYMAKPPYGGWVSFTSHLSLAKDYPLFKIGNKTEKKSRPFGYNVNYTNVSMNDLVKLPNLLITAVDKKYYEHLDKIPSATIVIHDPTELKEPVLNALKSGRFRVITIRKTVHDLLKKQHKINNKFLLHPFHKFAINPNTTKNKSISISRVDFDKHTDIIIDANDNNRQIKTDIWGAQNDLYAYHKLRDTNYKKYYKGKFGKTFSDLANLLEPAKFIVDMSAIKGDGGGSQYTFLEAIHFGCVLILNSKWTDNQKTPFVHGKNCYIVSNSDELNSILNKQMRKSQKSILENAKKLLVPHTKCRGW